MGQPPSSEAGLRRAPRVVYGGAVLCVMPRYKGDETLATVEKRMPDVRSAGSVCRGGRT